MGKSRQGGRGASDKARRDAFRDFVLDQLSALGNVTAKAMFGGHGLYADKVFFAIVWRQRMYVRTDDAMRAELVARGMRPFQPSVRQTLRTYYEVPADMLDDRRQLVQWARRAAASRGGMVREASPRQEPRRRTRT